MCCDAAIICGTWLFFEMIKKLQKPEDSAVGARNLAAGRQDYWRARGTMEAKAFAEQAAISAAGSVKYAVHAAGHDSPKAAAAADEAK